MAGINYPQSQSLTAGTYKKNVARKEWMVINTGAGDLNVAFHGSNDSGGATITLSAGGHLKFLQMKSAFTVDGNCVVVSEVTEETV